jgi:(p)ppGpp synthase/HD superfamily hydrolase
MPIEPLHLTGRFTSAIDYARHLHIERRKGTDIPYMSHLLGVASLVMGEAGQIDFAVTEDMVIAALLHDAAEDHGGILRLEDIEHKFGADVARLVGGLTDSFAEDSHDKEPWLERKYAYLDRLRKEAPDVQLISAADKLHNARAILEDYRAIGAKIWERFKRGREDQIWYFEELLEIYRSSGKNRIVDELGRVTAELKRLSEIENMKEVEPTSMTTVAANLGLVRLC